MDDSEDLPHESNKYMLLPLINPASKQILYLRKLKYNFPKYS